MAAHSTLNCVELLNACEHGVHPRWQLLYLNQFLLFFIYAWRDINFLVAWLLRFGGTDWQLEFVLLFAGHSL